MATKDPNRCWPGYEPVPGKPEHSQGSCKPKAESKLTRSEKKFRGKRKAQLDNWKRKHPASPRKAAQHLAGPEGASKRAAATKKATKKSAAKKSAAKKRAAKKASAKRAPVKRAR